MPWCTAASRRRSIAAGESFAVLRSEDESDSFLRPRAMDPHTVQGSIAHQIDQRLTDEDRRELHATPVVRVSDSPAEEIVQYARDHDIDLIVMGTHGRKNVAHLFIGSVAERVVRDAPCPVLTVREHQHQRHKDSPHTENASS